MPLDLIIPIAGFLTLYGVAALCVHVTRTINTRRRKAELRRARLERNWKEGRFDA